MIYLNFYLKFFPMNLLFGSSSWVSHSTAHREQILFTYTHFILNLTRFLGPYQDPASSGNESIGPVDNNNSHDRKIIIKHYIEHKATPSFYVFLGFLLLFVVNS